MRAVREEGGGSNGGSVLGPWALGSVLGREYSYSEYGSNLQLVGGILQLVGLQ